jgi:hypothetical protein
MEAQSMSNEPFAKSTSSPPPKSDSHEPQHSRPLKHLKEISLAEARKLGMFTDSELYITPVPSKPSKSGA